MSLENKVKEIQNRFDEIPSEEIVQTLIQIKDQFQSQITQEYLQGKLNVISAATKLSEKSLILWPNELNAETILAAISFEILLMFLLKSKVLFSDVSKNEENGFMIVFLDISLFDISLFDISLFDISFSVPLNKLYLHTGQRVSCLNHSSKESVLNTCPQ